jgi:hypothetical protein
METPETIKINDVVYARVAGQGSNDFAAMAPITAPKYILILQRGWVVVGDLAYDGPDMVRLANASVIRKWGTTKGLGQLALEGPLPGTVLDLCGSVEAHPLAIVARIPCEARKWVN